MSDPIAVHDLGLIAYAEALKKQEAAAADVIAGGPQRIFLLEHPPVITYGTGGGAEHLHVSQDWLAEQGVELFQTRRGGNVTCHFPGQLVAYPILQLQKRPGGLRQYFYDLEETVIRLLARYDLNAGREEGRAGVWMQQRKICSMGVAVRRWVSYHGLALNVAEDVSLFDAVTLCGLHGAQATSLHVELGRAGDSRRPAMDDVKKNLADELLQRFDASSSAQSKV